MVVAKVNDFTVDVIIAVRSREEYDVVERLRWRASYNIPTNVGFIIVDYGSEEAESRRIEEVCYSNNFKYIYVDARGELWNASKARNAAILESSADYLLFEDVDLISHADFYAWLNVQVRSLVQRAGWPFIVVPVSYLTQEKTEKLEISALDDDDYEDLTSEIYNPESKSIQFHAPTSSYLLCRRNDVIFIGGHDPAFEGWGFEDSDFALKLLRKTELLKPREFYRLDTRNYRDQVQWRGWRALYRIFGDLLANKGMYAFHVWHPIAEHRSPAIRDRNHKIFQQNTKIYSDERFSPSPLWNPNKPTHLFLSKNPHSFNSSLFEHFGNPMLLEERNIDPRHLEGLVKKYSVECIIFNNPYGNDLRRAIYFRCKDLGIRTFVVERGALPWSIYIDEQGFCADSLSYQEDKWPAVLSDADRLSTLEYIDNLRTTGAALEPQSGSIGGGNLKRTLFGECVAVKVLFVALQSPSDTTTNFFCGDVGSYDRFVSEIKILPHLLGPDWRIVYKNHPLTLKKEAIDGAKCVDAYHIGDILEMADSVALINSGVGVLAAAYRKPVFYFGKAFYSISGLNKAVKSATELANELENVFVVDSDKVVRFMSYLINNFYSFAKWERKERAHTEKAKLSISENIKYEVVRIDGNEWKFVVGKPPVDLQNSLLFDRYRLDDYLHRKEAASPKKVVVAASPRPAVAAAPAPVNGTAKVDTKPKLPVPKPTGNSASRKWRKLIRNPRLFFVDAVANRIARERA